MIPCILLCHISCPKVVPPKDIKSDLRLLTFLIWTHWFVKGTLCVNYIDGKGHPQHCLQPTPVINNIVNTLWGDKGLFMRAVNNTFYNLAVILLRSLRSTLSSGAIFNHSFIPKTITSVVSRRTGWISDMSGRYWDQLTMTYFKHDSCAGSKLSLFVSQPHSVLFSRQGECILGFLVNEQVF